MFGSEFVPILGLVVGLLFIPESPRWLIKMGREDEALNILTKIDGVDAAKAEVAEIHEAIELEKSQRSVSFMRLYRPVGCRALRTASDDDFWHDGDGDRTHRHGDVFSLPAQRRLRAHCPDVDGRDEQPEYLAVGVGDPGRDFPDQYTCASDGDRDLCPLSRDVPDELLLSAGQGILRGDLWHAGRDFHHPGGYLLRLCGVRLQNGS
jgi:hypothetical protein